MPGGSRTSPSSRNCISALLTEVASTGLCATEMEIHTHQDGLALAELLNNWTFRKDGGELPSTLGSVQLQEMR